MILLSMKAISDLLNLNVDSNEDVDDEELINDILGLSDNEDDDADSDGTVAYEEGYQEFIQKSSKEKKKGDPMPTGFDMGKWKGDDHPLEPLGPFGNRVSGKINVMNLKILLNYSFGNYL